MSGQSFKVALMQFTAGPELEANMQAVADYARQAKSAGASFLLTPENTEFMERDDAAKLARAQSEAGHQALARARSIARASGLWLLIGSLAVRLEGENRVANRSYLIDPTGAVVTHYDKIHLFDVDLPGRESYRESASVAPGARAVLADLPWGRIGLSVCYDLRFPHLFRALAKAGAQFLAVPAAFTVPTGKAHWHVLLRARAIESQAFVVAAAQSGTHQDGRTTYGHSLVIDPWGAVLLDTGQGEGLGFADIDLARIEWARRQIPVQKNRREITMPVKRF